MVKVQFLGQVLPICSNVSVHPDVTVDWNEPETGLEIKFGFEIKNSEIKVNCDLNRFEAGDFTPLYMRVHDMVQASVNLVAFAGGLGCAVSLHTLILPDGTSAPILLRDPNLPFLCTAFAINSESPDANAAFDKVYNLVLQEPDLFMALNELIAAITLPHISVVNCARSVEGIRHMISPPGTPTKDTWKIMRDNLQLDRSYIEVITSTSTGPRHGDRTHIPGSITTTICERSWTIMNRFLEYRKRGNHKLPVSEFPLLV